jgi:hypothetical protein
MDGHWQSFATKSFCLLESLRKLLMARVFEWLRGNKLTIIAKGPKPMPLLQSKVMNISGCSIGQ